VEQVNLVVMRRFGEQPLTEVSKRVVASVETETGSKYHAQTLSNGLKHIGMTLLSVYRFKIPSSMSK